MSIRVEVAGRKDVKGCEVVLGMVRTPAEGESVVRCSSDADEVLGLGLFIDWRLRAIRHACVIKSTGIRVHENCIGKVDQLRWTAWHLLL